jgi:hypothetical protein
MAGSFDWEDRVRPAPGVLFRQLGGETVLLHPDSGFYFGLDIMGTLVWQLLEEHGRLQPVLDALIREFEVEEERCRADLLRLVGELLENGLVVTATASPD